MPLHNTDELLIMASIVEKESGLPQELPKIAGLYLHRLSIGMRLQADPTVIYGLGDRYDGDIAHRRPAHRWALQHLYPRRACRRRPSPCPAPRPFDATAHPEKTDAIYFVASAKDDGSHVFSATLEEHNAAVAPIWRISVSKAAAESAR